MNLIKSIRTFVPNVMRVAQMSYKGDQSGATGSAGAIREAGGAFGKMGAAKEAEYFYKQQVEQLKNLTHKDVVSKEFQENKSTNTKDNGEKKSCTIKRKVVN